MADRFAVRKSRSGELARLEPLRHGRLQLTSPCQMVSEQFRPALSEVSKVLFQHRRHARVQFVPSCPQQRAVGRVLYQGVLEQMG